MRLPQTVVKVEYPGFPTVYAVAHEKQKVLDLFAELDRRSQQADKVYALSVERLRSMPSPTNEEINAVVDQVQEEIGKLSSGGATYSSSFPDGRRFGLREDPVTKQESHIYIPSFRGAVLRMLKQRFLLNEPAGVDEEILKMRFGSARNVEAPRPAPPLPPPPPTPPKPDVFVANTLPGVIFRRLRELGFKPPPTSHDESRYGSEWVWTRPSRSRPNIELRVFTTCFEKPDGSFGVKATGADAIRVVAYYTKHVIPRSLFAGRRILRTGDWRNIADRISERVDVVEAEIQNWKTCAKCGAPLFESKKGNWVCADICWKKGRYADY